jgi:hypothetical protein
MIGPIFLRLCSQVLHSVLGGTAVFCFIYAALVPDLQSVAVLLLEGGKWGICGWLVLFFQCKYLERSYS